MLEVEGRNYIPQVNAAAACDDLDGNGMLGLTAG